MSSQEILPGGIPSVGGPITFVGGTFEQIISSADAILWQLFARITLDLNTEYQASRPWTQNFTAWEGRVLDWGTIERSVPIPAGPPEIENARIRLADTDRRLRDLFLEETWRRRTVEIRLVERSAAAILDTPPIFTGEIFEMRFGTGYVELDLRSRLLGWLDEEIPVSIIGPIICGHVVAADGQGAILLQGSGARWLLACTVIDTLIAVYRSVPGESGFILVPPAEYEVTTSALNIYGLDLVQSFLNFYEAQPEGTQVRVDVDGIQFRGPWGTLPEASGTVLRNPIDTFINMTYFALFKHGIADPSDIFATAEISALRARFEEDGDLFAQCDGAIVLDQTMRQFMGEWLTSFELGLHQKQIGSEAGLLTLTCMTDTDASAPTVDESLIVLNTFHETAGRRAANETLARFGFNYATGVWDGFIAQPDEPAQSLIGVTIDSTRYPKTERLSVEFPWVREASTAAVTIARRMALQSIGTYRQTFDLPLPEVRDVLDIGQSFALTHRLGLQFGGYRGREVKILRTTLHLAQKRATVETVTRVPLIPTIEGTIDIVRVWYDVDGAQSYLQKYRVTPSGAVNGVNIIFTLPEVPILDSERIYVNGIFQIQGTDYTINDDTILFTVLFPPQTGDVIEVFYDVSGTGNLSRHWIVPSGAIDGVNEDFTLPEAAITDSERVYVNSQMMVQGVDYEMSSPTVIHFLNYSPTTGQGVPLAGDTLFVFYDVVGTRKTRRYRQTPIGPVNSINPLFILEETPVTNTEEIFVNSVLQIPTADYSFIQTFYIATFHPPDSTGILFTASPMRNPTT